MIGYAGLILAAWGAQPEIVINEIHHSPDVKTEAVEFIELYNAGLSSVDLAGWALSGGVELTFPAGTRLAAGEYLVAAQDPVAVKAKYGADALGPWRGRLDGQGESVVLQDAAGIEVDRVDYGLGFPWPVVGDPPGYSIELLNPGADNDLGGHWRASVTASSGAQSTVVLDVGGRWRYAKGTSAPPAGWTEPGFDDAAWLEGPAPIGYDPEVAFGTQLTDMRGKYAGFFLRTTFQLSGAVDVSSLALEALYDDGFKLWVNGREIANLGMPAGNVSFDQLAAPVRENNNYELSTVQVPAGLLREGTNVVAVHVANISLGESSDCFFDARLRAIRGPTGRGPTPGRRNSVYVARVPPAIRQLKASPGQPRSGQPVTISAKVTSAAGMDRVDLQYQVVEPGGYIELTDPAYRTNWVTLPMNDAGVEGDLVAADNVYAAILPAGVQRHRRLIRYRLVAVDLAGQTAQAPGENDPEPNFAFYCYDGVPAWTGAVRPGLTPTFTVSTAEMNRLPVYSLLAKRAAVEACTWTDRSHGDEYFWQGTLVVDGEVYDHVRFRPRGGVWRYAMGKNMWKFDFNRGHDFQARDDWGRKLKTKWTKLNLGACIQQGDYQHRGEQGMFESVGFRLFRLVGVPAMNTCFVQFRIVDEPLEVNVNDQYGGDFWGLYLAVEQPDGRFLDEHGLADGNLYKMEGGWGDPNNLGPTGPTDSSDLQSFMSGYQTASSESWWRSHLNLPAYFGYQTIVQAIHHYDIADGKNYFYHRDPQTGIWTVIPWDLDLTWADNMYRAGQQGGDEPFKSRLLANFAASPNRPQILREFRNRVREVRDLLWNADEAFRLIDEYALRLRGTNTWSILDADRAQWDYNPLMANSGLVLPSKAGQGRFYQNGTPTKDFAGMVQLMKNYVGYRATNAVFSLDTMAAEPDRPARPTVSYAGPAGHPVDRLEFRVSAFAGSTFGALQWRLAEITRTDHRSYDPTLPQAYEITPTWESGALTNAALEFRFPAGATKVGRLYRARARYLDSLGRASHWSLPIEFTAGEPDQTALLVANLRLTELMYAPPGGSDFEFLELVNRSPNQTLNLAGATFTEGISFMFPEGTTLAPQQHLLVVGARTNSDFGEFRAHYGLDARTPIVGPYSGSLRNEGETVTLKSAAGGQTLISFTYGDGRGWPLAADGGGHSLVPWLRSETGQASGSLDYPGNWRASAVIGGSPGRSDPTPSPALVISEVVVRSTANTPPGHGNWIELHNRTGQDFLLGPSWYLSDSEDELRKWMIPADTVVPREGWIVFEETSSFHVPDLGGFGLDWAGGKLYLSYLPGTTEDRVVDSMRFGAQAEGVSVGRHPTRPEWFVTLDSPTPGNANRPPPSHPWLSELMYHPPDLIEGTNAVDNRAAEFIEITAGGPGAELLASTAAGSWRLRGEADFTFPEEFVLTAGNSVLVVSFDPSDLAAATAFRQTYGLTNATVRLLGPYIGHLSHRSGRVTLERPLRASVPGGTIAWETIDEVIYADQDPWPTAADGDGMALHRTTATEPGPDPQSWKAAPPTPGVAEAAEEGDTDGDGMPDGWETGYGLDPHDPADAAADADGDGMTNRAEWLAGTNPRSPESRLRLEVDGPNSAGEMILRFQAARARPYVLERATDLGSADWERVQSVSARDSDQLVVLVVAGPSDSRPVSTYFRLVYAP